MMKRWILCLVLLVLPLSGCFRGPAQPTDAPPVSTQSDIPAKPLPPSAVTPPETEAAPPEVVWSWLPTHKDYTASDSTVVMTAEFAVPAIDNPTGYAPWAAINDYYADLAAQLLRDADDQALWAVDDYAMSKESGFEFSPYFMQQHMSITLETAQFVSILRTGSAGIVGTDAGTWAFAEQFDLTTGKRLALSDLFDGLAGDAQATVLAAVKQAAQGTEWAGQDALLERHFSVERFYLTESALVVFYNPGSLGAAEGEPILFPIPYNQLGEAWRGW